MKKIYKNVTVTVDEPEQDFRNRDQKLAEMLLDVSDTDIRKAMRIVANNSPKRLVRITQSCHGRLYDMLGLGCI